MFYSGGGGGCSDDQGKNILSKECLTYNSDNMETAIIKVSSKGQIVIPAEWRKRLCIEKGDELLAIGEDDMLVLKKIDKSVLKKEFLETVKPIRKKIKKLGVKKSDLDDAVKKARRENRYYR